MLSEAIEVEVDISCAILTDHMVGRELQHPIHLESAGLFDLSNLERD
jgi:hypothetical protein